MAFLVFLVWLGAFGRLPSREIIKNVEVAEGSYLYDRNGEYITRYYDQNRESVEAAQIPQVLRDALVATEDERFQQHSGIDWQATARAVVYSGLLGREEQGGGSTLSQQLAKNHFPRERGGTFRLVVTKIKEALTARRFEKEYSKDELLTLYLNSVPFGEDIYGVKLASRRFFGVEPKDLKPEQAAVLIGMLKANSSYNPVWHPEASRKRRNVVLQRMGQQAFISPAASDSLQALPLTLNEDLAATRSPATYFSDRVRPEIDAILERLPGHGGNAYTVDKSGLRIYTTIDVELQQMAERALREHIAAIQPAFRDQYRRRDPDGFAPQLEQSIKRSRRYKSLLREGLDEAAALERFAERRKINFEDYSALGRRTTTTSYRDSVRAELLRLRAGFVVADPHSGEVLAYVGGTDHFAVPYNSAAAKRQVGSTFKPLVYAVAIESGMQPCDYFKNEKVTYGSGADKYTPANCRRALRRGVQHDGGTGQIGEHDRGGSRQGGAPATRQATRRPARSRRRTRRY